MFLTYDQEWEDINSRWRSLDERKWILKSKSRAQLEENVSEGYWYNRVTGADVEESHRAGWSGVNDTLSVPFLLHNLSGPTEWQS